jgi:putative aldouronate transport system substrate-binding protein
VSTSEQRLLITQATSGHLSRRQFVLRAAQLGLSAGMVTSVLSACGGGEAGGQNVKPPTLKAPDPDRFIGKHWPVKVLQPPKKYDPPLVITQSPPYWFGEYKKGENGNDNVLFRFFAEKMGVYYRYSWDFTSADVSQQKWSLALASNKLPEFMSCVPVEIYDRLRRANRLLDIKTVWEKTATDNTKRKFEYPDGPLWNIVSFDDQLFGLPFSNARSFADNMLFYRKDILDKLGAKPPATLEEFRALNEEIVGAKLAKYALAVANESATHTVTYLGSLDPVWGAFGVMPTRWIEKDDGKVVYGSVQPDIKRALEYIRGWYSSGVFDKEFYNVPPGDETGVTSNVVSGDAAMYYGPWWSAGIGEDIKTNVPAAETGFVATPPTGPDGRRGRADTQPYYGMSAFEKDVDPLKAEAVINHLNWLMDRFDQQMDNADYFNQGSRYLFDTYDYAIKGGQLEPTNNSTTSYGGGAEDPVFRYPNQLTDFFAKVDQLRGRPESELNLVEKSLVSDPWNLFGMRAYNEAVQSGGDNIASAFTGPPTATQTSQGGNLSKIEVQIFTDIIVGRQPVSAFDEFVSQWTSRGGDKITDEINDWYQNA